MVEMVEMAHSVGSQGLIHYILCVRGVAPISTTPQGALP